MSLRNRRESFDTRTVLAAWTGILDIETARSVRPGADVPGPNLITENDRKLTRLLGHLLRTENPKLVWLIREGVAPLISCAIERQLPKAEESYMAYAREKLFNSLSSYQDTPAEDQEGVRHLLSRDIEIWVKVQQECLGNSFVLSPIPEPERAEIEEAIKRTDPKPATPSQQGDGEPELF